MEIQYFYRHRERVTGPLSQEEVLTRLHTKELKWSDLLYTDRSPSAKPVLAFLEFGVILCQSLQARMHLGVRPQDVHGHYFDRNWFLFKSENCLGPFSHLEIVQMMQEKAIQSEDYLWTPGKEGWHHLSDWEVFSRPHIHSLKAQGPREFQGVFFKRRHPRAPFSSSLIVNDAKRMYHGATVEISEGGAGIRLQSHVFAVGNRVFLHFKSGEGVPAFNAVGEIVSKYHFQENDNSEIRYGVKFLNVSNLVKDSIRTYTMAQTTV